MIEERARAAEERRRAAWHACVRCGLPHEGAGKLCVSCDSTPSECAEELATLRHELDVAHAECSQLRVLADAALSMDFEDGTACELCDPRGLPLPVQWKASRAGEEDRFFQTRDEALGAIGKLVVAPVAPSQHELPPANAETRQARRLSVLLFDAVRAYATAPLGAALEAVMRRQQLIDRATTRLSDEIPAWQELIAQWRAAPPEQLSQCCLDAEKNGHSHCPRCSRELWILREMRR